MFSDASEALMKSRVLLLAGLYAGLFTLANHFYPVLEAPPLHEWLPLPVLGLLAAVILVGQMAAAVVADHYGLFGLAQHQITPLRILGVVFLLVGVALIRLF